ncbi:UDP-glucuronosyltransferase 2A1-like [Elysia marginata]|uniref:UDP-glucuronosyltransferase 2A1-like n=1 Tax=Elysia marginata TaxID=1093978 RepID=A0AAV4ERG9_9GAST|nr:UDP-glucuronosyltransferase 2A1-like [Elysia marginata]
MDSKHGPYQNKWKQNLRQQKCGFLDECSEFLGQRESQTRLYELKLIQEDHSSRPYEKRQATFLGHVMRREKLEHLITTGKLDGKRGRGKQREKMMDGLKRWLGSGSSTETMTAMGHRGLWRNMIADASKHGTG